MRHLLYIRIKITNTSSRNKMCCVNCIELAKERDRWWAVVFGVVNFQIFIECGSFDWLRNLQFYHKDFSTWRQLPLFLSSGV